MSILVGLSVFLAKVLSVVFEFFQKFSKIIKWNKNIFLIVHSNGCSVWRIFIHGCKHIKRNAIL